MERELWESVYVLARSFDRSAGVFYKDWEIVVIYMWAVIHDRPTSWACQRQHWQKDQLVRLPNQSTVSRRLQSAAVKDLVNEIQSSLAATHHRRYLCIDGKPLVVSDHSKDPDARNGKAGKGFSKGYRLHAIWGNSPIPEVFEVTGMNTGEAKVARQLVNDLECPNDTWLVGDKQYDSNPLHDAAHEHGIQLIAQQKRSGGLGHCKHSPHRLRCFAILKTKLGASLLKYRERIERYFGKLTCTSIGLSCLPAWVRRKWRVKLWVQAKLMINAIHTKFTEQKQRQALA